MLWIHLDKLILYFIFKWGLSLNILNFYIQIGNSIECSVDPASLKATVTIPDGYKRGHAFILFRHSSNGFEMGELCDISNIKACACRPTATTEIVHAWI